VRSKLNRQQCLLRSEFFNWIKTKESPTFWITTDPYLSGSVPFRCDPFFMPFKQLPCTMRLVPSRKRHLEQLETDGDFHLLRICVRKVSWKMFQWYNMKRKPKYWNHGFLGHGDMQSSVGIRTFDRNFLLQSSGWKFTPLTKKTASKLDLLHYKVSHLNTHHRQTLISRKNIG
jgi:hypothetical protein